MKMASRKSSGTRSRRFWTSARFLSCRIVARSVGGASEIESVSMYSVGIDMAGVLYNCPRVLELQERLYEQQR